MVHYTALLIAQVHKHNVHGKWHRAKGTGQRAQGKGQRAQSKRHRAERTGQRAQGKGHRAKGTGVLQCYMCQPDILSWERGAECRRHEANMSTPFRGAYIH